MNMALIDWSVVFALILLMIVLTIRSRKYSRSVADFLAGSRCAKRYIISTAEGASSLGAITLLGFFQMYYNGGFCMTWWNMLFTVSAIVIAMSGWVTYRYRVTRALTLGQFFGMRYGKKFRVFAGILCWVSGVINFGVFPAVGARFFIYFCGFPENINILGLEISTFALTAFVLILLPIFLAIISGQVAVILTDFVQGLFTNIVFILILGFVFFKFEWSQVIQALSQASQDQSMINPMASTGAKDFNMWYFFMATFLYFYGVLAWQGSGGYAASAKNPHEGRMGKILSNWRGIPMWLFVMIMPVCAYTVMNSSDFSVNAQAVNEMMSGISNKHLQNQAIVPFALVTILPKGLLGCFCAMMFAACMGTHDTYLHSWGSILIQDVVMPLRKKELEPAQHKRWLRYSVIMVGVLIYILCLILPQTDYILMFLMITGAIWLGGAGAVIIGGLYWKKGTVQAAFTTLITGSLLAVTGIITKQIWDECPLNGQQMSFVIAVISIVLYVVVSLITCKEDFNMDKLLHRGKYAVKDDKVSGSNMPVRGFKALLGVTDEFNNWDKLLYYMTMAWSIGISMLFVIGTTLSIIFNFTRDIWTKFWYGYVIFMFSLSVLITIWIGVGGLLNLQDMLKSLRNMKQDNTDDGRVD